MIEKSFGAIYKNVYNSFVTSAILINFNQVNEATLSQKTVGPTEFHFKIINNFQTEEENEFYPKETAHITVFASNGLLTGSKLAWCLTFYLFKRQNV